MRPRAGAAASPDRVRSMSSSRSMAGNRADDREDQPAGRSAGVDAGVKDLQRDAAFLEVVEPVQMEDVVQLAVRLPGASISAAQRLKVQEEARLAWWIECEDISGHFPGREAAVARTRQYRRR